MCFIQHTWLYYFPYIHFKSSKAVRVKTQSMAQNELLRHVHARIPAHCLHVFPRQNSHKSMLSVSCGNPILSAEEGHVTLTTTFPPRKDILPNRHVHTPTWKKRPSPCGNSPHPAFKDIAAQARHSTAMARVCHHSQGYTSSFHHHCRMECDVTAAAGDTWDTAHLTTSRLQNAVPCHLLSCILESLREQGWTPTVTVSSTGQWERRQLTFLTWSSFSSVK